MTGGKSLGGGGQLDEDFQVLFPVGHGIQRISQFVGNHSLVPEQSYQPSPDVRVGVIHPFESPLFLQATEQG